MGSALRAVDPATMKVCPHLASFITLPSLEALGGSRPILRPEGIRTGDD